LNAAAVLGLFGGGVEARSAYERFVAEGLGQPSPWESLKGQVYLGSELFHAQMKKRLSGKNPKGVSRRQLNPIRPSVQSVLRAVADAYGIKPAAALKRESGPAFKQSVYLLRRRANLSLREVAEMAGVTIGRVAQIQSEIESLPRDEQLEQIVAKL
jgi:hypothetical protein